MDVNQDEIDKLLADAEESMRSVGLTPDAPPAPSFVEGSPVPPSPPPLLSPTNLTPAATDDIDALLAEVELADAQLPAASADAPPVDPSALLEEDEPTDVSEGDVKQLNESDPAAGMKDSEDDELEEMFDDDSQGAALDVLDAAGIEPAEASAKADLIESSPLRPLADSPVPPVVSSVPPSPPPPLAPSDSHSDLDALLAEVNEAAEELDVAKPTESPATASALTDELDLDKLLAEEESASGTVVAEPLEEPRPSSPQASPAAPAEDDDLDFDELEAVLAEDKPSPSHPLPPSPPPPLDIAPSPAALADLIRKKNYDEAIRLGRKLLEQKLAPPDHIRAGINLAGALVESGKAAESAKVLKKLIDQYPYCVPARRNLEYVMNQTV